MMPAEPDWSPPGVDTGRANPARVYDYWLGGTHNFLADQDLAGRSPPSTRTSGRSPGPTGRSWAGPSGS